MNKLGIMQNWNKPLYIASKKSVEIDDYNNEIVTYDVPFKLGNVNYQPVTGRDLYAYISAYGETKEKLIRLFLDIKYKGKIKEFDLAYLYGTQPEDEEVNGENANYRVITVAEQNTKILVLFREIIKGGNN